MALNEIVDKSAPMPSAPMLYNEDGSVDWGNMWDSFCLLALDGGPPHRPQILRAQPNPDVESETYQFALSEIMRGVREVSGLEVQPDKPGWIKVTCYDSKMASWVSNAMNYENVESRVEEKLLFVPVGDYFTLKGEIKNVITAVAKATHYWMEHLPYEVKLAISAQQWFTRQRKRIGTLLGR